MIKQHKYRVYPTEEQQFILNQWFGCCRWVWNWALDKKKSAYETTGQTLSISDLGKQLTQLKKDPEYDWLQDPPADTLLYVLRNLDRAFQNFFRRVKEGENPGYPRFKSKYDRRRSLQFRRTSISREGGYIDVPKMDPLKAVIHRPLDGDHYQRTRTLIHTPSDKYFVSVVIEDGASYPEVGPPDNEKLLGVDHGVVKSLTLSNGTTFDLNLRYRHLENHLERQQKKLSRKQKGSNNYTKQRIRVAKVYEKIRWKRKYDIENMVVDLVDYLLSNNYEGIVIRKYDLQDMLAKIEPVPDGTGDYKKNGRKIQKNINRSIASAGLGYLYRQISEKLPLEGLSVFVIDASETKTTRRCSRCDSERVNVDLTSRRTHCGNCGLNMDMDLNAAKSTLRQFQQGSVASSQVAL